MKTLAALCLVCLLSVPAHASGWSFGIDGGLAVPTQAYFPAYIGDLNSVSACCGEINYQNPMNAGPGWMISAYALHKITNWIDAGILYSYDNTGASAPEPFLPANYFYGHPFDKPGNLHPFPQAQAVGLGNVETNAIFAYMRIHPWTFGNWIPFMGIGLGFSWNTWMTPTYIVDIVNMQAHVSDAIVTRLELGADYAVSNHLALEILAGGQINDPSVEVVWPINGTDNRMNLTFFFVAAGIHFGF